MDFLFVIPNQQVFTTNITNTRKLPDQKVRFHNEKFATVTMLTQQSGSSRDLIDKEPFALHSPPPSVYVNELGENSVNIVIRIWAPISEWYVLKTRFPWVIKKILEENNIEVPLPQREVYIHNVPENKKMPEKKI